MATKKPRRMDTNKTFQVSVKGMHFDEGGKLLMIKESSGLWELPGGRLEWGEDFIEALERECQEELGLRCEVLDNNPHAIWPAMDIEGRGRLVVCFKIRFDSLDFRASEEAEEIGFFTKEEVAKLPGYPQLERLTDFM